MDTYVSEMSINARINRKEGTLKTTKIVTNHQVKRHHVAAVKMCRNMTATRYTESKF